LPDVIPIAQPTIPAEYFSDVVVVPAELQADYATLAAGTSGVNWAQADLRSVDLRLRRAHLYFNFAQPRMVANEFHIRTFGDRRSEADRVMLGLADGFPLVFIDRFFDASQNQGHYNVYFPAQYPDPGWTLGGTAWIADWMLSNYPGIVRDVTPMVRVNHGEGRGNDI